MLLYPKLLPLTSSIKSARDRSNSRRVGRLIRMRRRNMPAKMIHEAGLPGDSLTFITVTEVRQRLPTPRSNRRTCKLFRLPGPESLSSLRNSGSEQPNQDRECDFAPRTLQASGDVMEPGKLHQRL